ncbi:MAG: histidinol dehydrogenase [Phycisphaerales bacterium]|nr:histidinol dehydrogenase [Phycisphaerales bacterium]
MSTPNAPPSRLLPRLTPDQVQRAQRQAVDPQALTLAAAIIDDVRRRGIDAVQEHAQRLGDIKPGEPLIIERAALRSAIDRIDREHRRILEKAAERITNFATAQRSTLTDLSINQSGAAIGHTIAPIHRAGCYAPGGRYPLPSSVLMTVCTARAAGVQEVWLASPKPTAITLAAAGIAGADNLIPIGGAHAIAALGLGAGSIPACDVLAGPGNQWVTAAKQLLFGRVGIDMLAGPSEVLIIADDSADPRKLAADMLAQAEHDTQAAVWLITTGTVLADAVEDQLARQLPTLPTADIARQALTNGGIVICDSLDQAIAISDALAPEHLEVMTRNPDTLAARCRNYGAIFIGHSAAEVIGDYGLGPNHTLPTGGTARFTGGLSVFHFLRIRTFIRADRPLDPQLYTDIATFARAEGLEAHARAAETRLP